MHYTVEDLVSKVKGHYDQTLNPIAEQFLFQRPPTFGELNRPPMVLALGNHSSGKSTFINHLIGSDVQNTGVAPTDDDFTIITYGDTEDDRDGPAVVSNPDLPYQDLRHFGDSLVSHVKLKRRPSELLRNITLIDSPGMIDEAKAEDGRGFDFPGVVRWFAERADIVLVFFDPDKPGTTGETLQVFNRSLKGIDHKLMIVMNKMDQFRNMHDFARACGTLCWNLGKVIPRKDLPLIYNTFVPVEGQPAPTLPMQDFEKARNALIVELKRAPARRLDNIITQMQSFAERLRLHAFVIDEAAAELGRKRAAFWAFWILAMGGATAAAVATGLLTAVPFIAGAGAVAALIFQLAYFRREKKRKATKLSETFEQMYDLELLVRDHSDDLRMLWDQIKPRAEDVAIKRGLDSFAKLQRWDREQLDCLIEIDIPQLRSELYESLNHGALSNNALLEEPKEIANDASPRLLHAGE